MPFFFPYFLPLEILGLCPYSPPQVYGIQLAFGSYHNFRHTNSVSMDSLIRYIKSLTRGCDKARKFCNDSARRIRSRFLPPLSPSPSSPPGATSQSASSASPILPSQFGSDSDLLNRRLLLPNHRLHVLRARGVIIPAGPLPCVARAV